jgi:hypothetical protein
MKKFIFIVASLVISFFAWDIASAHPGGTDSSGGHHCWTNCAKWGLSYGQYHYHNGGSGYTYKYNTYTPPPAPSCPIFSSYDSLTGDCKCNSGYRVDKGIFGDDQCVSELTYCTNHFGYGAKSNYLTGECECKSGYSFNGSRCEFDLSGYTYTPPSIDWSKYNSPTYNDTASSDTNITCKKKHGNGARYNSTSDSCECKKGYVLNDNDQCEEGQLWCQREYGGGKKDRVLYSKDDETCYSCGEGMRITKDKKCESVNYKAPVNTNYKVVKDTSIYEKMSSKSKVLGSVKKGDSIEVTKVISGWAKIKLENGKFGYVLRNKINSK